MLFVLFNWKPEDVGIDISTSLNKFQMNRIVEIELKGRRNSLKATPKRLASFFDNVIGRESIK